MPKRLYIDLDKCRQCTECQAVCSYYYHPCNDGTTCLREIAEFSVKCRHCEEAPCEKSCPQNALEKQANGIIQRYNMRCISCKTCAYACPFGIILPELIPYAASTCDYCLNRLPENEVPVCLDSCTEAAIQFGEFKADEKAFQFEVNTHLIVHAIPWKKENYPQST